MARQLNVMLQIPSGAVSFLGSPSVVTENSTCLFSVRKAKEGLVLSLETMYSSTPLPFMASLSAVSVMQGQLWSENIKQKLPEMNN